MNIDGTEIAILAVIAAVAGLISMVGDLCASATVSYTHLDVYKRQVRMIAGAG